MTTKTHKKSIYDSDEMPDREDKKQAIELFYQDGKPDTVAMAAELAMQRRYSVKNSRDNRALHIKVDNLTSMGQSCDNKLISQGETQTQMIKKQGDISDTVNQIKGMGKISVVLIPVMITVIGIILALK